MGHRRGTVERMRERERVNERIMKGREKREIKVTHKLEERREIASGDGI